MTFDGLITIFALLIAVLAILPKYRRIDIFLKFGSLDWMILILTGLVLIYLQFYSTFVILEFNPNWGLSRYDLTPKNVSFLIILLVSIIICVHVRFAPLPKKKIRKLHDLANELLRSGQFTETINLLEKNLDRLRRIYFNNFFLARLKRKLSPQPQSPMTPQMLELIKGMGNGIDKTKENMFAKLWQGFVSNISRYLPNYQRSEDDAQEFFRNLLTSEKFCKAVVEIKPYFALKIFDLDVNERPTFIYNFLTCLYNDKSSILYSELENNQNKSHTHRYGYDLPESNRLLYYLFNDSHVAEKLAVWNPIGNSVINELDNLARTPNDYYNLAMDDYYNISKWKSSLYIAIFFFDVMVTSALHQGITWHMWLYRYPKFIKGMVRNYNPNDPLIDIDSEWITKYNYLMYEIISNLRDWIIAIKDIPLDQPNIKLESANAFHENGNIPKSSILALSYCIHTILTSDKITEEFKSSIMNIVYDLYLDLRSIPGLLDYSIVLRNALKQVCDFGKSEYYKSELTRTFILYKRDHWDIRHKLEDREDFQNFLSSL